MNAPARIRKPTAIRADESEFESAVRRSISIHCPNDDEMTMAARVDIATMRDLATVGRQRAGGEAADILAVVSRVATDAVYAPAPCSKLLRIRSALGLAIEAARSIERAVADGR